MSTPPKDAQDLFDKLIPEGIRQHPDKVSALKAIYCFKIAGTGGGTWTVDCTSNPPTCTRGDSSRAQCTIEVSNEDFKTLLGDPNATMQFYFLNKLRISGNLTLAMKLQTLFEIASSK